MRNFKVGEDAVSPIIGVVLMVGLTVVMVSAVAVSIFAFSIPFKNAPHARIVVVEARGDIGNEPLHHNVLMLKHKGGDTLQENYTKIIITGKGYSYTGTDPKLSNARNVRVIYEDLTGENDIFGAEDEEIVKGTSWEAGQQIELYGRDGNIDKNTVDGKWKLQSGSDVVITVIDIPTNQVIAVARATVKQI